MAHKIVFMMICEMADMIACETAGETTEKKMVMTADKIFGITVWQVVVVQVFQKTCFVTKIVVVGKVTVITTQIVITDKGFCN